ncbi:MAG: hypothetical protein EA388_11685 [Nitriliruptor sp.]|nr:MAG: hypothetical protein EA388_11685 [Nitriliruptor sp.]
MSLSDRRRRLRSRRRTRRARRRFDFVLRQPGLDLLPVRGELLPGYVETVDDPSEGNLAIVLEVARAANVEVTAVPSSDLEKTLIAIDERNRSSLIAELLARARCEPLFAKLRGSPPQPLSEIGSQLEACQAVTVFVYRRDAKTRFVQGARFGCRIAFASRSDERWSIVVNNRVATSVPEDQLERVPTTVLGHRLQTFRPLAEVVPATSVTFPIDVVYTWVDTDDPEWRLAREQAATRNPGLTLHAAGSSRFTSRDELRFSLRSLAKFAPWVRTIYLVTANQWPTWLSDHPQLKLVPHEEIFPNPADLPTFNSHAIEANLHRIDGLSEQFLYLNDDVYFGRPVAPETFFEASGLPRVFLSRNHLDLGPPRADEPAVMSAGKRNRDLLEAATGRTITQKLLHAPHPVRRSVMKELEGRFSDEFALTRSARFRSPTDISPIALHAHYSLVTDRAATGSLAYGYLDSSWSDFGQRLRRWARQRDWDALCINDSTADEPELVAAWRTARGVLVDVLPSAAGWEAATVEP